MPPIQYEMNDPRKVGREAIQATVPRELWEKNVAFTDELKQLIAQHKLSHHPLQGILNNEKLNDEVTRIIHLEFAYGFAQIFTDSLIHAMAASSGLEARLGPMGKVSARFLLQLNLLDELGFAPSEKLTGDYSGNPYLAHYSQFAETLKQLGANPQDILTFKASPAAKAARRTFTDYYENYTSLCGVLACAETVFTIFAGPWAKSVSMSTKIDTSTGYHAIHVEDHDGNFLDDEHSEDTWFIFRQSVTPEQYDEMRDQFSQWLDIWSDFSDNVMHLARTVSKK
jgi:hypothetical protein